MSLENQMTEVKAVGKKKKRLLEDLRNRRKYWELKEEEEEEDRKIWKQQFFHININNIYRFSFTSPQTC